MTRGADNAGTRYRKISVAIWNDDKFPFLADDLKLVWFHILTTPASTPFGLFKISVSALADEMRWPLERYREAFDGLIGEGLTEYDERHLVLRLRRFLDYNSPANPNVVKSWSKLFSEVPNSRPKAAFRDALARLVSDLGPPFLAAFESTFPERVSLTLSEEAPQAIIAGTGNSAVTAPPGPALVSDNSDMERVGDTLPPTTSHNKPADMITALESNEISDMERVSPHRSRNSNSKNPPVVPPGEKTPVGKKAQRAHRLPEDFTVPEEWKKNAAAARNRHGMPPADLDLEATRFENHWIGNSTRAGAKSNWSRAFTNWCLKDIVKGNGLDPVGLVTAPPDPDPVLWGLSPDSTFVGYKGSKLYVFDVPGSGIVEVPRKPPSPRRP